MFEDLRSVDPFTSLEDAEIISQLVDQHTADKGIGVDALGLQLADDVVQPQAFVPIVHHQRRADGKRFIFVRRKLRCPQLELFLHKFKAGGHV